MTIIAMSNQETVIFGSLMSLNNSFYSVVKRMFEGLGSLLKVKIYTASLKPLSINSKVSIGQESGNKYIDIDFDNMEKDKLYLAKYDDELYAFQKVSDSELKTYDVI